MMMMDKIVDCAKALEFQASGIAALNLSLNFGVETVSPVYLSLYPFDLIFSLHVTMLK